MVAFGYALSSEEHRPLDLVRNARRAEEAGFSFALISDHFHPWVDQQGHSPFVWSVLGAIASSTERMQFGTGVTCPTVRMHPAIVAHAAATVATMMPGRFFLGVGTGENLNEHVTGEPWPAIDMRRDMLAEAIEVIRQLWQGDYQTYYGDYYTVQQARLYTLPDQPPPLMIAASGSEIAQMAGDMGDGLISTSANNEVVEAFENGGGHGKPRIGMVHACWAADDAEARRIAHKWWPNSALKGDLGQELRLPRDFEAACALVREEDAVEGMAYGPDPQKYVEQVQQYQQAGFDHIYFHQVGPDQEGFLQFAQRELLPRLEHTPARLATRS